MHPYRTPTGHWDIAALRAARARGLTLQQLGTAAGVTRERIRSLLVRAAARDALGLPFHARMAESDGPTRTRVDGSSGTCDE